MPAERPGMLRSFPAADPCNSRPRLPDKVNGG